MSAARDRPPADPSAADRLVVGAVVTAYRPGPQLATNVRDLAGQVAAVVVVDDGSGPDYDARFADLESEGARLIRLPENAGIGAALNAGVGALTGDRSQPRPDAVLFLDQDSTPGPGLVGSLSGALLAASADSIPVAGSAPEFFGDTSQARGRRGGRAIAPKPIQSGLLVLTGALTALGPFRDDYFIDLVDTEFAMRAQEAGFVFVVADGARLPHALGRQVALPSPRGALRGPSGDPLAFTVSAPFRYYYRARNRVALNREYRARRPLTTARDTLLEARHYLIVWLAIRERRTFLALLRAGRRAGRARRMGRMPDAVASAAARLTWRFPL
ncbi:glycosyltransferase [Microbacterium sp. NPDC057407]|uniref:glycosyltransferase n=1 Tax=Microbacterium sp. NPDC057407 TaxID=3346120 RepID=UPI00366B04CF